MVAQSDMPSCPGPNMPSGSPHTQQPHARATGLYRPPRRSRSLVHLLTPPSPRTQSRLGPRSLLPFGDTPPGPHSFFTGLSPHGSTNAAALHNTSSQGSQGVQSRNSDMQAEGVGAHAAEHEQHLQHISERDLRRQLPRLHIPPPSRPSSPVALAARNTRLQALSQVPPCSAPSSFVQSELTPFTLDLTPSSPPECAVRPRACADWLAATDYAAAIFHGRALAIDPALGTVKPASTDLYGGCCGSEASSSPSVHPLTAPPYMQRTPLPLAFTPLPPLPPLFHSAKRQAALRGKSRSLVLPVRGTVCVPCCVRVE